MRMTRGTQSAGYRGAVLPLYEPTKTNGEANRIDPIDLPVHDWYRFVLSFPPHLVRKYVRRFDLSNGAVLLDPFCGTGTTIVECQKMGLHAVGLEALPMPVLASRVKTCWTVEPQSLLRHASLLAEKALADLNDQGIPDDPSLPVRASPQNLRSLPTHTFRLLLKNSISPLPLHKTLVLRDRILADKDNPFREQELLALAKALVTTIGNLKFGPEVGLGRIKNNAFVVQPWLANIRRMSEDLKLLFPQTWPQACIYRADAREISSILSPSSIDAVFTSPPYPNEKDYTRTTRLETVVLGLAQSMTDLRDSKKTLVRSNTRSVYRTDRDDDLVEHNATIQRIAKEIEKRREYGKDIGLRTALSQSSEALFWRNGEAPILPSEYIASRRLAWIRCWRPGILSSRDDSYRTHSGRTG